MILRLQTKRWLNVSGKQSSPTTSMTNETQSRLSQLSWEAKPGDKVYLGEWPKLDEKLKESELGNQEL